MHPRACFSSAISVCSALIRACFSCKKCINLNPLECILLTATEVEACMMVDASKANEHRVFKIPDRIVGQALTSHGDRTVPEAISISQTICRRLSVNVVSCL